MNIILFSSFYMVFDDRISIVFLFCFGKARWFDNSVMFLVLDFLVEIKGDFYLLGDLEGEFLFDLLYLT